MLFHVTGMSKSREAIRRGLPNAITSTGRRRDSVYAFSRGCWPACLVIVKSVRYGSPSTIIMVQAVAKILSDLPTGLSAGFIGFVESVRRDG